MTMLTSWKLDPHTVVRLKSGRRGDDALKGGHLACSSHKQAPTLREKGLSYKNTIKVKTFSICNILKEINGFMPNVTD